MATATASAQTRDSPASGGEHDDIPAGGGFFGRVPILSAGIRFEQRDAPGLAENRLRHRCAQPLDQRAWQLVGGATNAISVVSVLVSLILKVVFCVIAAAEAVLAGCVVQQDLVAAQCEHGQRAAGAQDLQQQAHQHDRAESGLDALTNLEHLNLAGNELSSVGNLAHLTKLEELNLSENKLTSLQGIMPPNLIVGFTTRNVARVG
ncbi:hypothetical protein ON010_g14264 [Phytophthora cinnamomi]|nr:hypothetical protein ON010_g14264 [Phytophthora cinnamomi]